MPHVSAEWPVKSVTEAPSLLRHPSKTIPAIFQPWRQAEQQNTDTHTEYQHEVIKAGVSIFNKLLTPQNQNLKQNGAKTACAESTRKGVNWRSKDVTRMQQQRPQSTTACRETQGSHSMQNCAWILHFSGVVCILATSLRHRTLNNNTS